MTRDLPSVEVVGAGRMGTALAVALREAGYRVAGPSGRGAAGEHADIVLLAVPDAALADAAHAIRPGRLVGHLSGATPLDPLSPHRGFSLHPLITITGAQAHRAGPSPFRGASAAVAGADEQAIGVAEELAQSLGMTAIHVEDRDRAAYHAAASIASNFLITLEWVAERLAATAGVGRDALAPLIFAAVRNWEELGPEAALTGPIVRGDAETLERQRAAVAERIPEHLALFDALAADTRDLAESRDARPAPSSTPPDPRTAPETEGR